jgi:hypothetical protein
MKKTSRFYLNWAIEAAEARRDQWLARADNNQCEASDCWEETAEAAREIGDGIERGIRVANSAVTESEALWAMMLWEEASAQKVWDEDKADLYHWLADGEGAYQARDNALLIAAQMMEASDWAYDNGFDDSEDWEFIPRLVPVIIANVDSPQTFNKHVAMECTKVVVANYLEEKNMPQGTGTGGKDDWGSIGEPS